jgi:hypothetical protein
LFAVLGVRRNEVVGVESSGHVRRSKEVSIELGTIHFMIKIVSCLTAIPARGQRVWILKVNPLLKSTENNGNNYILVRLNHV